MKWVSLLDKISLSRSVQYCAMVKGSTVSFAKVPVFNSLYPINEFCVLSVYRLYIRLSLEYLFSYFVSQ